MLVFLGGLIPRWTHNQRINDLKELNKKLEAALDRRDEQFDAMIGPLTIAVKALEDLKKASQESRPVS